MDATLIVAGIAAVFAGLQAWCSYQRLQLDRQRITRRIVRRVH